MKIRLGKGVIVLCLEHRGPSTRIVNADVHQWYFRAKMDGNSARGADDLIQSYRLLWLTSLNSMQCVDPQLIYAHIAVSCLHFRIVGWSIALCRIWPRNAKVDVLAQLWDQAKEKVDSLLPFLHSCTPTKTIAREIVLMAHSLSNKPGSLLPLVIETKLLCLWWTLRE